jgi:acyl-coenzyme A thioesterase PaaI-like protein
MVRLVHRPPCSLIHRRTYRSSRRMFRFSALEAARAVARAGIVSARFASSSQPSSGAGSPPKQRAPPPVLPDLRGEANPFRRGITGHAVESMQHRFWGTGPTTGGVCYGCGPANPQGLQLQSFVSAEDLAPTATNDGGMFVVRRLEAVACFRPQAHHLAFPNVLNGGVIATILDCHCNILASYFLMRSREGPAATRLPTLTVTARFEMDLKRPTHMDGNVYVWARVETSESDPAKGRVWITGALYGPDALTDVAAVPTALCRGKFAAAKHSS